MQTQYEALVLVPFEITPVYNTVLNSCAGHQHDAAPAAAYASPDALEPVVTVPIPNHDL